MLKFYQFYLTLLHKISSTSRPTKPPLLKSPTILVILPITLPKGLAPKTTSIATLNPISDTTKLVPPLTKLPDSSLINYLSYVSP